MSARVRAPLSEERLLSRRGSSHQDVILVAAASDKRTAERKTPQPTPAPLSAKEQKMADDLARLFTVQEERCFSRASRDNPNLSRVSLTSSQLPDASFIYQHVDFEMLSRCVPGFVKSHLSKNGRYLPETFILRVNYWRRRRALGDDSTAKRAAKETAAKENAAKESAAKENAAKNPGDQTTSQSRLTSAKSSRTQSVSSKQTSLSESRITLISGYAS